ncbi:cytochrome P450 [Fennellomyces sp. T-0311]|nr:cytochrome P450 [Fennellomyces sp. T-0311]
MTTFQPASFIPTGSSISKRASIAATICFIVYFITFNSKRKQVSGIKDIPTLDYSIPYFGHIFRINRKLPALQFHQWHKKYGPIFQIKLGVQNWVVISDRYMAHDILGVKGSITGGRPHNTFSKYHAPNHGGFGLISPDQTWKQNRTLSQEMLSSKSITMSAFIIQSEAERIADQLLKNTKEDSGVNTIKYMQLVVLNIMMQIIFGLSAGTIDNPIAEAMLDNIDKIVKFADLRNDLGGFLPLFAPLINIITRKEKAMSDYVNNSLHPLLRQFIDESYKTDTECFVKQLYKAMDDGKIDESGILALCSELAGAAVDTTAMTLSWGFVILCHHKDVQQKIQKEIDTFVTNHNRLPTFEERESLPFLLSVQKECMRYRTPVHINLPHTAQKDGKTK